MSGQLWLFPDIIQPHHNCSPITVKMLKGPVATSLGKGSKGEHWAQTQQKPAEGGDLGFWAGLQSSPAAWGEAGLPLTSVRKGHVLCLLHFAYFCTSQQQAKMGLDYKSLEKGFECFSHVITAELESGVMEKAYTERLLFPNFSFSAERQCQKSLTFMLQSLGKWIKKSTYANRSV